MEQESQSKISLVTNLDLGAYYDKHKNMTYQDYQSQYFSKESIQSAHDSFLPRTFYQGNSLLKKMEELNSIYLQDYQETLERIPHIEISDELKKEDLIYNAYSKKKILLDIYELRSQMYQELLNNEICMRNHQVIEANLSTRDYEQIAYEIEENYAQKIKLLFENYDN